MSAIILVLSNCSTTTEKQFNEAIQQKQILEELIKTNELLKKEFGKGSDFWCQIIGPGMSVYKKYDSSVPPTQKKTLNQADINSNKNNTLR